MGLHVFDGDVVHAIDFFEDEDWHGHGLDYGRVLEG
jgi:hypothetical protein